MTGGEKTWTIECGICKADVTDPAAGRAHLEVCPPPRDPSGRYTSHTDPRFGAEPIGRRNGVNSYQITFNGVPVTSNRTGAPIIVPASYALNALARVVREADNRGD